MAFLLFLVLLVVCWPLALVAVVFFPLIWLILLPFRILGFALHGVFSLIAAIFLAPFRLLRAL